MSLQSAALALAGKGLAVFPLKAKDKAPATRRGFKEATTDPAIIKAWWEAGPEQNIGIATGERSGVLFLDVDGETGEATLAALCAEHGELPATVESITGTGRHLAFRYPAGISIGCTAGRLGPGLDTRGNGGYVVAPPSIHPTGKRYAWSVGCAKEFTDAPDWLIELLRDDRPKTNGANWHPAWNRTGEDPERIRDALHSIPADDYDVYVRVGMALASELGDGGFDLYREWAMRSIKFSENDIRTKWRSIKPDGGVTIATVFGLAYERGWRYEQPKLHVGKTETRAKSKQQPRGPGWRETSTTAAQLQQARFPDVSWIIPALIPEGLTLLAGKPKIGKSWLALDLCLGVAGNRHVMGGIKPEHGDVLYCALEDNQRRLQKRVHKLIWPADTAWPERLTLATTWRRLDQGGVDDIAEWANGVASPKLVVLDTLAGVRPVRTRDGYTEDYDALAAVHRLANDRGLGILVLHHTRKMDAEDPVDMVSGTLGLAGCADTVMVLNRTGQGTTLYGRGRDIEEFEEAAEFLKEACRWRLLGKAEDVRRTDSQKKILAALAEIGPDQTMGPKQIATACKLDENNVGVTLFRMHKDGEVEKEGRGNYRLARKPDNPTPS